jgi:hypothetical protein
MLMIILFKVKFRNLQLGSGVGSADSVLNLSSLDGGGVDKDGSSKGSKRNHSGLLGGSLQDGNGENR